MAKQVTCCDPDNNDADRRIQGIGGSGWYRKIDDAIRDVESDPGSYYVSAHGQSVWVVVEKHPKSGRKYLTTEGDGFPPNNLLNLPKCP